MFIEEKIIGAVKKLLAGRANEVLGELQFSIPLIEFETSAAGNGITPDVALYQYERSEKERLIALNVYSIQITFSVQETSGSELYCYAYAAAVEKALKENPTLDGIVTNSVITGKKYVPPKKKYCGQGWELSISCHITTEGNA